MNSIPGTPGGPHSDEVFPPRREGARDHLDMLGLTCPGEIVDLSVSPAVRQDECSLSSNTPSTNTLLAFTTAEDSITQKVEAIRHTGD